MSHLRPQPRCLWRALLAAWIGLLCATLTARCQNADFEAANRLYEQGQFAEAAAGYQKLIDAGQASAAVLFNLGNAWFKSGKIGRAVVAYRQAATLRRATPDVWPTCSSPATRFMARESSPRPGNVGSAS
jgi:tetratricopeptide (TPR) repeat protein